MKRPSASGMPLAGGRTSGFSAIELLVAITILFTLSAIALTYLWRANLAAQEASAVVSLRLINRAEQVYYSTYDDGFSDTLQELGPPQPGIAPSDDAADLIPADLASGIKAGYQFTYTRVGSVLGRKGRKRIRAVVYTIRANPIRPGATGVRYFYSDETAVIRFAVGKLATITSPLL